MYQHSTTGQPAQIQRVFNDRAVFFHSDEPITRMRMFNPTVTIDHVQFGYTPVYVPELGTAAMLALSTALLARRRRGVAIPAP